MARYIEDNRYTQLFVAGSLETLLPQDSAARTIRAALDRLNFADFDARYKNDEVGRPALAPRSLVGVWILALLRGQGSAVKLAALCGQDIELRWLLGDAPVGKSLLSDFRLRHEAQITSLGSQVLVALGRAGLLPGENLGVDGTIVRAASSRHSVRTRKGLAKQLAHVESLLRERLSEDDEACGEQDQALQHHRIKLAQALEQMDQMGLSGEKDRLNTTEPSAKLMRQKNGSFAPGYNIQAVPDLDSGVLNHTQVVDAGGDGGQLAPQMEQAGAALQRAGVLAQEGGASRLAADGAYHDTRQLAQLEQQGMACYVLEDRNTNRQTPNASPEYQSDAFTYDAPTNTVQCPQGQTLAYRKNNSTNISAVYQAKASCCAACPAKEHCCPKTKEGRSISRSLYAQVLQTVQQRVASEQGHAMRRARWITCEGVMARVKGLLHWDRCRMWGLEGAKTELAWRHLTYNLMLLAGAWKPMVGRPNLA